MLARPSLVNTTLAALLATSVLPLTAIRLLPGMVARFSVTAPTLLGCIINDYRKVGIRSQQNLLFLWFSRFIVFMGYAAFIQFAALYIDSNYEWKAWLAALGFGASELDTWQPLAVGAIMACFVIGGLGGGLLGGPLAKRHGKKPVIAAGMLLSGLVAIPLVLIRDVWPAMVVGFFVGMGWGAFIAADWAFACTLMPKKKAGSYMGMWDISTLLPQVLAPVISGLLYQVVYAAHAGGDWLRLSLTTENIPAEDPVSAALAYKWIIASVPIYFAIGLLILRKVREPKVAEQAR